MSDPNSKPEVSLRKDLIYNSCDSIDSLTDEIERIQINVEEEEEEEVKKVYDLFVSFFKKKLIDSYESVYVLKTSRKIGSNALTSFFYDSKFFFSLFEKTTIGYYAEGLKEKAEKDGVEVKKIAVINQETSEVAILDVEGEEKKKILKVITLYEGRLIRKVRDNNYYFRLSTKEVNKISKKKRNKYHDFPVFFVGSFLFFLLPQVAEARYNYSQGFYCQETPFCCDSVLWMSSLVVPTLLFLLLTETVFNYLKSRNQDDASNNYFIRIIAFIGFFCCVALTIPIIFCIENEVFLSIFYSLGLLGLLLITLYAYLLGNNLFAPKEEDTKIQSDIIIIKANLEELLSKKKDRKGKKK